MRIVLAVADFLVAFLCAKSGFYVSDKWSRFGAFLLAFLLGLSGIELLR